MKKKKISISAVLIAKNEEEKIGDSLESVNWVDEIIVIDTGSTDKTPSIAKKYSARVIFYEGNDYSDWRNKGLKEAAGDWVFYIDADERCTPLLKKEILKRIKEENDYAAYAVPRRNFIFGKEFKYGGEWPDYQIRLLRKNKTKRWAGKLHERPEFTGDLGYLDEPLIHKKHDDLESMVEKTNFWSEFEAELLYHSGHPHMSWWRFLRIMSTEAFSRFIIKQGFRDGKQGIIYSFYQVWSKFLTYVKLWEMQINKEIK